MSHTPPASLPEAKRVTPFVGGIARQAFDAAAALGRVERMEDLERVVRAPLEAIGFTHFIYTESKGADLRLVAGTPPHPWWAQFMSGQYAGDDIVCLTARAHPDPFFFSDVTRRLGLTTLQKRINAERIAAGVGDGYIDRAHHRDGTVTAVVMSGAEVDADDPDVRVAALVYAAYLSAAMLRLDVPRSFAPAPAELTPRQIECLTWVRDGKSATDIGAILGISAYTVRDHIGQACERLGVRTRVQAVVAAFVLGLLNP